MKTLNIRALREAAGLTVPQLAASMGVAPYLIERWEAGLLNPLLSDLPLLVKVLGCDYNAVFVERPWEMEDEYEAC